MASLISSRFSVSENEFDKNEGEESMKLAISCSVCSKPYKTPKILPRCAHSFCLHCIAGLAGRTTEIRCPECQVVNSIGSKGGADLKTNVQLEKIVGIMTKAEDDRMSCIRSATPSRNSTVIVDSCSHSESPMSFCSHCDTKFCHLCCVVHKERLKLEMTELAEQFQQKVNDSLEKSLPNIKDAISCNLKEVEKEIDEAFSRLATLLESAISEEKVNLLENMDQMVKAKLVEVDKATENLRNITGPVEILQKLSRTSVLNMSLSEMASLRAQMSSVESQISICEALKSKVAKCRLRFVHSINEEWVQHIVASGVLRWKDQPNEKQEIDAVKLKEEPKENHQSSVLMGENEQAEKQPDDVLELKDESEEKPQTDASNLADGPEENEESILKEVLTKAHDAVIDDDVKFFRDILKKHILSRASLLKIAQLPGRNDLTPLHLAAYKGRLDVLKVLVERFHADLFATVGDNRTALHLAAEHGHVQIVKYLVKRKPSLCQTVDSRQGRTPLHAAVNRAQVGVVDYLIRERKLNTETPCNFGRTALHLAVMIDRPVIVELLLSNGANIYAVDAFGNQPIHLAVVRGAIENVRVLVRHRADIVNVVNQKGETPLEIARFNGFDSVAALLMDVQCYLQSNAQFYWT